jgi:cytochrome c oxidase assembly protein subunit 15
MYKKLVVAAALLAFCVVVLGAYVRLSDAGLGCPDWPGCYGHIAVPKTDNQLAAAAQAFPDKPVESRKAWKEMIHRYFAGTLGLLIIAIAIIAWRKRRELQQSPRLPSVLVALVIFQALLGMWTVTLLLKPVIVSAHLLGGMTTLALLVWLALRQIGTGPRLDMLSIRRLRIWGLLGLLLVFVQIALGGWVSSNYAALACTEFPLCQGAWLPPMDFSHAFHFRRELGMTAEGELLPMAALTAIHWTHRMGAYIVFAYIGWLALQVLRIRYLRGVGTALLLVLLAQVSLGVANVLLSLPLPVAVLHNAGAALLLITMVVLNFRLNQQ